MVIDFNPMTNCFSTKKMKSNLKLNKIEEDNNNNSADSGSILPKKYSRKKYSYIYQFIVIFGNLFTVPICVVERP